MTLLGLTAKFGVALALLGALGAAGQTVQLGGKWLPTDLNYGVLKDLRQNLLQSLPDQIAGDARKHRQ